MKKDDKLVGLLIPVDLQVITEAEGPGIEMKEKIIDPRIEVVVTLVEITGTLRIEILDITDRIMMIIEIPQGPPITGEGPDPHLTVTEKDINKR